MESLVKFLQVVAGIVASDLFVPLQESRQGSAIFAPSLQRTIEVFGSRTRGTHRADVQCCISLTTKASNQHWHNHGGIWKGEGASYERTILNPWLEVWTMSPFALQIFHPDKRKDAGPDTNQEHEHHQCVIEAASPSHVR